MHCSRVGCGMPYLCRVVGCCSPVHTEPTHLGVCGQADGSAAQLDLALPSYHPCQAGGSAAQLDLARDAGAAVGNGEAGYWRVQCSVADQNARPTDLPLAGYWRMQNGYLLPDRPSGLEQATARPL